MGLSESPVDYNLGTLRNPVYYSIKRQVHSETHTQRSFTISESQRYFCWLFALPPVHSSLGQRPDPPVDCTSSENQSQADDGVGGWTWIVAGLWLTLRQGSAQEAVQSQEGHCPGASFLPLQKYPLTDLFWKKNVLWTQPDVSSWPLPHIILLKNRRKVLQVVNSFS